MDKKDKRKIITAMILAAIAIIIAIIGATAITINMSQTAFAELRADLRGLRGEIGDLRVEISGLRGEINDLRVELAELRGMITAHLAWHRMLDNRK